MITNIIYDIKCDKSNTEHDIGNIVLSALPAEEGAVIQRDDHWYKRLPVVFCGAPPRSQSTTEGSLIGAYCMDLDTIKLAG